MRVLTPPKISHIWGGGHQISITFPIFGRFQKNFLVRHLFMPARQKKFWRALTQNDKKIGFWKSKIRQKRPKKGKNCQKWGVPFSAGNSATTSKMFVKCLKWSCLPVFHVKSPSRSQHDILRKIENFNFWIFSGVREALSHFHENFIKLK